RRTGACGRSARRPRGWASRAPPRSRRGSSCAARSARSPPTRGSSSWGSCARWPDSFRRRHHAMSLADKVILSCALTGAVTTKKPGPATPYTPAEIGEEARRAWDAGATIVHIHARTDDGLPTWEVDTFRRIKEEVHKRSPVLINWSTGGLGPMEGRVGHLALRPAIAALNMGSMNYAKWRKDKKDFAFNFVFQNPFHDIIAFAKAIKEAGAKPELECFDTGHTASA